MLNSALNEIPPISSEKNGWPWTQPTPPSTDAISNDFLWPRISIVTPSFNQAQYLEETIRSVLLQGYPNLEYIIVDGGSTDGSVALIRKYENWLSYWVSEPDQGQAHAINKGFARSTGDLIGWINSDDYLLAGALHHIARGYQQNPDAILLGDVIHFSDNGSFSKVVPQKQVTFQNMVNVWTLYTSAAGWSQQGTFVPRSLYEQVGGLDETLRYVFDRDWMCHLTQVAPVKYLKVPVATFRKHNTSKTVAETPNWLSEEKAVTQRYQHQLDIDDELLQAGLEMYGALMNLSITDHWNRRKGFLHLQRALVHDWKIFLSKEALNLVARSLMPLSILDFSKGAFNRLKVWK